MLRPKDVAGLLGISAPTLRVWSTQFAPVLSPAARPAKTESGGAAQRRYTEQDLACFRRAKQLLDSGSTFEQALEALQARAPAEPPADAPEPLASAAASDAPALVEQTHPIIQAFEEALHAKDETIRSLETRVAEVTAMKNQTIAQLEARVVELQNRPEITPAPAVVQPRFRWGWLNKLLTAETQSVG